MDQNYRHTLTAADLRAAGLAPAAVLRLRILRGRTYLQQLGFTRQEADRLIFAGWLAHRRGTFGS